MTPRVASQLCLDPRDMFKFQSGDLSIRFTTSCIASVGTASHFLEYLQETQWFLYGFLWFNPPIIGPFPGGFSHHFWVQESPSQASLAPSLGGMSCAAVATPPMGPPVDRWLDGGLMRLDGQVKPCDKPFFNGDIVGIPTSSRYVY